MSRLSTVLICVCLLPACHARALLDPSQSDESGSFQRTTGGCVQPGTLPQQPPPRVVRPCPDATSGTGVWEDVTPDELRNAGDVTVVEVVIDPSDPAVVYTSGSAGSGSGKRSGIFKSTDCGANWEKVSTGRNGAALDTGFQWSIEIDPIEPQVLYAANGYGSPLSLFKSTNGGADWDDLFPPGSFVSQYVESSFVQAISIDPTDHTHLVASFHVNCRAPYEPSCIGESRDSGRTWTLAKLPTDGWAEGAGPLMIGCARFLYAVPFGAIYLTTDHGATWTKTGPDASGNQLYKAPNGDLFIGSFQHGVLRSTDNGSSWTTLPNSPNATAVWGDGVSIFASYQNDSSGRPYHTASLADLNQWTNMEMNGASKQGAAYFGYDSAHRILYAASYSGGLWRTVTR
jgi:hypothetical protein